MQTEATKETGQRFALPVPASGEVTLGDLRAIKPGDFVQLRGHRPSPSGDWYIVTKAWPVETASAGGHSVYVDCHKIGAPNIRNTGELRDRWTHPAGYVWPGSPRECVIFNGASALQAAE